MTRRRPRLAPYFNVAFLGHELPAPFLAGPGGAAIAAIPGYFAGVQVQFQHAVAMLSNERPTVDLEDRMNLPPPEYSAAISIFGFCFCLGARRIERNTAENMRTLLHREVGKKEAAFNRWLVRIIGGAMGVIGATACFLALLGV